MEKMTMGEIAFLETAKDWDDAIISARRCMCRLIAQDEVWAESLFRQLPTAVRDALIKDWERNNLEGEIRRVGG